jgi:hypothetical protein
MELIFIEDTFKYFVVVVALLELELRPYIHLEPLQPFL